MYWIDWRKGEGYGRSSRNKLTLILLLSLLILCDFEQQYLLEEEVVLISYIYVCVCSGCVKKNEVNPPIFFSLWMAHYSWALVFVSKKTALYIYMISLFIVEGRGVSPYGGIDPFKYLTLWLYSTLKVLIDWIFNTLNQILGDVLWR